MASSIATAHLVPCGRCYGLRGPALHRSPGSVHLPQPVPSFPRVYKSPLFFPYILFQRIMAPGPAACNLDPADAQGLRSQCWGRVCPSGEGVPTPWGRVAATVEASVLSILSVCYGLRLKP